MFTLLQTNIKETELIEKFGNCLFFQKSNQYNEVTIIYF